MLPHDAIAASAGRPGLTVVAQASGGVQLITPRVVLRRTVQAPVAVAVHPTRTAAFVATLDGAIHWISEEANRQIVPPAHHRRHHRLAASRHHLASVDERGTLRLYAGRTGERLAAFAGLRSGPLRCVEGGRWLSTSSDGEAVLIDPAAGAMEPIGRQGAPVLALAAHGDTIYLASSRGLQRVSGQGHIHLEGSLRPIDLWADDAGLHLLTPRRVHCFCPQTLTPRARRDHQLLHPHSLHPTPSGVRAYGDDGAEDGPRLPRQLSAWGDQRAWIAGSLLHDGSGAGRRLPSPGVFAVCSETLTGALDQQGNAVVSGRGVVANGARGLHLGAQTVGWTRAGRVGWQNGQEQVEREGACLAVHPSDAWIAWADDLIQVVRPDGTPASAPTPPPFRTPVVALGVGPDPQRLLIADWAGRLVLAQLGPTVEHWPLCRLDRTPRELGLLRDGAHAWVRLADDVVAILRLQDGTVARAIPAHAAFDRLGGVVVGSVAAAPPLA